MMMTHSFSGFYVLINARHTAFRDRLSPSVEIKLWKNELVWLAEHQLFRGMACSKQCHGALWNSQQCQVTLRTFYTVFRVRFAGGGFTCSQQQQQCQGGTMNSPSIFKALGSHWSAKLWEIFCSALVTPQGQNVHLQLEIACSILTLTLNGS